MFDGWTRWKDGKQGVNALAAVTRVRCWPGVLVLAVAWCVFHDALHADAVFAYRDALHFYPPIDAFVRDEWQAGRVPLWNPYLNGGQPLAGVGTSGAFYPPNMLAIMCLPAGLSDTVLPVLHIVWAAAGVWRLARVLGCPSVASCSAGLAYAFGGCVLLQIYNPIYAVGAAWLGWACVGGWRLLEAPTPGNVLLLAVSLAMCVLGGDPQTAYHAGLVLGMRWLSVRPLRWRELMLLAAAGVAGGLLSFVQVALTAEFTAESSRAMDVAPHSLWDLPRYVALPAETRGLGRWYDVILGAAPGASRHYADTYAFSLTPLRLLECVWPDAGGMPYARWATLIGLDSRDAWVNSLYAGVVPAAAVIVAVGRRRAGSAALRFWLVILGLALAASLGGTGLIGIVRNAVALAGGRWADIGYRPGDEVGGLYWLLSVAAPGYAAFRYPAKWLTVFALAAACVTGLVVARLDRPAWRRRLARVLVGIGGTTGAGVLILLIAAAAVGSAAVLPAGRQPERSAAVFGAVLGGGIHACLASLVAAWCLTTGQAAGNTPRAGRAVLLCLLSACDLATAGRREVLVGSFADLVASSGYLETLKASRMPELAAASPRMRVVVIEGRLRRADTRDVPRFVRFNAATLRANVPLLHGVEKFAEVGTAMDDDVEAITTARWIDGGFVLPRRVFDLAAIDYFLVPADDAASPAAERFLKGWSAGQLAGRDEGPEPVGPPLPTSAPPISGLSEERPVMIVVRNESSLPRVRIVHDAIHEPPVTKRDWSRWEARLRGIAFPNPTWPDLRRRVVVEDTPAAAGAAAAEPAAAAAPAAVEGTRIVVDEPQRTIVEASLAQPGYLVLADTFHRDWHLVVRSDGGQPRPEPILRANGIHRACRLPAGSHVLEFSYRSATFSRGVWITLIAWAIAVLMVVGAPAVRGLITRRRRP